jgi:hypothetical protein
MFAKSSSAVKSTSPYFSLKSPQIIADLLKDKEEMSTRLAKLESILAVQALSSDTPSVPTTAQAITSAESTAGVDQATWCARAASSSRLPEVLPGLF